ncbi:response regulator transcription factor [Actinacidiphila bryophytorum]|uniref:Transcriptional regulator n=1 Tax=Actinacidiphila bryophytorum TaxID=1436133 RepID=A0A9W4H8F8_9ACTN|nr:response regulator transcription factor [Actinacidiphila bryophytorum]MBM9438278.1 response regulator transcription factor [Actinacidiphila bryophytorum]MBN6547651.1 response regulator transcription factor [Actinacidiphila bryophytorum]CAG7657860.1 Transcriptional regulator [Actinacidiphila bryophytorum]
MRLAESETPNGYASLTWRILIAEGDVDQADHLAHQLRRYGHKVQHVQTADAALRLARDADLIILDLELPDADGLEVCRSIRSVDSTPLIAAAVSENELDCVLSLRAGADDFLRKPYRIREIMARTDAIMRRVHPRPSGHIIKHGQLNINEVSREVHLDGQQIGVTRKEFDLLHALASRSGRVLGRDDLMREVWGNSWSRRTLDTHVSSLRSKLGSSDWIVTVRGIGFRLGQG